MTEHWVQIYFNRKEIKYISHSNIRASVENCPPKLHNLLRFSPPFHPWHFVRLPPPLWASQVSAIHVFLVRIIFHKGTITGSQVYILLGLSCCGPDGNNQKLNLNPGYPSITHIFNLSFMDNDKLCVIGNSLINFLGPFSAWKASSLP